MRISDWSSDVCSSDLTASVTKRSLSPPQTCPLSAVKPTSQERPNQESNCWIRQAARCCLMPKLGVEQSRPAAFYVDLIHQSNTGQRSRSEERRVGNECVSTGKSRWSPDH